MKNYIFALVFIIISFITGLSLAFNICSLIGQEEYFFKTKKKVIFVYFSSIVFAIVFTAFSYVAVLELQRKL